MPQRWKSTPDWVDLQNILGALGDEYQVVVYFSTRLRSGKVECIGKTYGAPYSSEGTPIHVALVTFPVQLHKDLVTTYFQIAWDLWCQHDRGGQTAAARGAPRDWQGYPEVPGRRRVK